MKILLLHPTILSKLGTWAGHGGIWQLIWAGSAVLPTRNKTEHSGVCVSSIYDLLGTIGNTVTNLRDSLRLGLDQNPWIRNQWNGRKPFLSTLIWNMLCLVEQIPQHAEIFATSRARPLLLNREIKVLSSKHERQVFGARSRRLKLPLLCALRSDRNRFRQVGSLHYRLRRHFVCSHAIPVHPGCLATVSLRHLSAPGCATARMLRIRRFSRCHTPTWPFSETSRQRGTPLALVSLCHAAHCPPPAKNTSVSLARWHDLAERPVRNELCFLPGWKRTARFRRVH